MKSKKLELYKTLKKVILRSFGIQNLWNYKHMQLFGYLYALLPLYEYIFTKDEIKKRLNIEWDYFNTHPYMVSYILALHSKMLIFNEDEKSIKRSRNLLMAPLASLGDSFFWSTLRSFLTAFAILITLLFSTNLLLAVILLLISLFIFNIFHFYHIFIGFKKTFTYGRFNLKFSKKFFLLEKMINFVTATTFIIIISHILIKLTSYKFKQINNFIIFLFFLLLNYGLMKIVKNKYIIVLVNFIISLFIVLGRFI